MLFLGVLFVYLAVIRGVIEIYDARAMLAVTQNLVNHGSLRTTGTGFVDTFHDASPYSPYGIAMSLLAVPPYALSKVVGRMALLVSLVNPCLTALAVVGVFRVARALRWSVIYALLAAIAYGLMTMAAWYTTEGMSEPGVALCVVLIVYGIIRWGQGASLAPLWVGVGAGAAIQFRPDSLFTVWIGLLALPLFVGWRQILRWRASSLLIGPIVLSAIGLASYNQLRYHKLFVRSYGVGTSFHNPILVGLHGLLFSSGKGLFLFNPLALLGVVGLAILFKKNTPVAILFTLLIVPRLIFFSVWTGWSGGWCWGPRYLLPTLPLLMISAVEVLRTADRTPYRMIVRYVAVVLAVVSLVLNFLSLAIQEQAWQEVLATASLRRRMGIGDLSTAVAQVNAFNFHLATSPIWGDILLLHRGMVTMPPYHWSAPYWWNHGQTVIGLVLMLAGLGCLAWVLSVAGKADPETAP